MKKIPSKTIADINTAEDLAQITGIHPNNVRHGIYKMAALGQITLRQFGKDNKYYYLDRLDAEKYVEAKKNK